MSCSVCVHELFSSVLAWRAPCLSECAERWSQNSTENNNTCHPDPTRNAWPNVQPCGLVRALTPDVWFVGRGYLIRGLGLSACGSFGPGIRGCGLPGHGGGTLKRHSTHPRRNRSTRTQHRETSSLRHRSQPRPRQNVGERQTSRQRRVQSSPRGDASRSSHRSDGSGRTPGELSSSSSSWSAELPRDPSQQERRRFRL